MFVRQLMQRGATVSGDLSAGFLLEYAGCCTVNGHCESWITFAIFGRNFCSRLPSHTYIFKPWNISHPQIMIVEKIYKSYKRKFWRKPCPSPCINCVHTILASYFLLYLTTLLNCYNLSLSIRRTVVSMVRCWPVTNSSTHLFFFEMGMKKTCDKNDLLIMNDIQWMNSMTFGCVWKLSFKVLCELITF